MIRLRSVAALAAAFTCLLSPALTWAAETSTTKTTPAKGEDTPVNLPTDDGGAASSQSATGSGSLVRTIVGLAIVLLVIYGVYWVLKQVKSSREESAKGEGLMTVASLGLGPNRALHLVRAGHEVILVGVAEHAITPIRSYTEAEAIAAGLLDMPQIDVDGEVIEGAVSAGADTGAKEITTGTPSIRDFLPVLRPKAGAKTAQPITLQAFLGQLKEKTVRS